MGMMGRKKWVWCQMNPVPAEAFSFVGEQDRRVVVVDSVHMPPITTHSN